MSGLLYFLDLLHYNLSWVVGYCYINVYREGINLGL